jgi:signal transduction histidine kinase
MEPTTECPQSAYDAAGGKVEARERELRDLAVSKAEFLATVSHELRTPLTSLSGLLELMVDADPGEPVRGQIVHALRRNTRRLVVTVDDLLLLARIEADRVPLDLRPVDTHALLGPLLEPLRTDAISRGISVRDSSNKSEPAVRILGDPHWLERMIRFLVVGSFGSDRPGSCTVHGAVHDGAWTLTVSGDALPIATADLGGVSEPDSTEGIGIGLGITLARAIAGRHGGRLRIEHGPALPSVQITLPVLSG